MHFSISAGARRRFLHLVGMAAALAVLSATLSGHGAWSQTSRPIKIVVAVPPGAAADILARLLAEQISRTQGLSMVIENRPGAAGIIGTEAVSHAAPDGNTLLLITPTFVLNPHLRKLNYDPLTSFGSICYLVRTPTVIVVNSASPYRTLADLMNAARAKPGELTLAATGPATPAQIAFEMLNVRGVAPRRLRVIAALELRPDRGAPGGDVFLAAAGYRRAAHHPEQHLRPISIPSQLMCHLPAGRGA